MEIQIGLHQMHSFGDELVTVMAGDEPNSWRIESEGHAPFMVLADCEEELEYQVGRELLRAF